MNYLDKLGKILLQAEAAGSEKESETFMERAFALAQSQGLSLELARQAQKDKTKRESPIQRTITLGSAGKKGLKHYVKLFMAIGRANDVTFNIAHNSTYVIAFGFPSDIDVTEMLYASLLSQMVEASDKYIRSAAYKREVTEVPIYESRYDYWEGRNKRTVVGYKTKPVDGRVARSNFMDAFTNRVSARLSEARTLAVAEAESVREALVAETGTESTGTELVLANKALEVRNFYKENSNAKGSWRGGSGSSGYSSASRNAGDAAGSRARLSGTRAIGGSRTAISG